MQYRSNKGFTGGSQLGILTGLTCAGLVAVSVVQMLAAMLLIPSGTPMEAIGDAMMDVLKDPRNVGIARILQAVGTLLLFFLPAILYSGISNGWNRLWLGFSKHVGIPQLALGFAIIFATNIAASSLEDVSKMILGYFPSADKLARELENTYNESVKVIGLIRSWPELIIALLIMAFLPALFEEIYFRGAMQQLFHRWWQSPVLSIVISSLIFSLIHFSFYLFLSRFALGLALGIMFYLSRNIWVSIFAHFMNNAIAVVQLYVVSRGKKEINPEDLSQDFGLWIVLSSFPLLFILIRLLNRFSEKNRNRIAEEEKRLPTVFPYQL